MQELSGYALEPWKPVTGETLFRRESGAVASQFHDPPSIEPYSSELVATERGIVLGKKSGLDSIRIKAEELGLDVPEERRAELLAKVKELGDAQARARQRRRVPRARGWLSTTQSSSAAASTRSPAARCSRAGWRVCVLERNDWLGGAIQTAELTEPGFHHDVFSAWHPLWVGGAAHAQLGDELAARGLEYLNTELPTATAFPDGEAAFLLRDADGNARELGPEWPRRARAVLAERRPRVRRARHGAVVAGRARARGRRPCGGSAAPGRSRFTGELLQSSRDWLETTFASERAHGVLAPWVLHTGLGPDAATSGFMTQVIAVAVQEGGMPIPRGGGAKLADALVQLIRDHGGACETGRDVERVVVRPGRAVGVRLTDGEVIDAERAVIANVTPTQLYERLLGDATCRAGRRAARAVPLRPLGDADPLRAVGAAALGGRRAARADGDRPCHARARRRLARRERGRARAAARGGDVVVGQPLTMDPVPRARGQGAALDPAAGAAVAVKGDAAGEIDVGTASGRRPARALRRPDPGAARAAHPEPRVVDPRSASALGPHDLERANVNLRHGDPYGGSLALDQNFLWRPFPRSPGHATPVERLWHIGASTWPGPGARRRLGDARRAGAA